MLKRLFMMNILAFVVFTITTGCSIMAKAETWDDDDELTFGQPLPPDPPQRSPLGWSASGQLFSGAPNKSVSMQCVFPEAGGYTVQFKITALADGLEQSRPVAIVTWSVSGNHVVRKFDVSAGTSISGVGEGVNVRVIDESSVNDPTVPYRIDITVAKGTRPTTQTPPTYRAFESWQPLASAATLTVPIPEGTGAKEFLVLFGNDSPWVEATDWATVNQVNSAASVSKNGMNPNTPQWIPLGANVTELQITQTSTGGEAQVQVVFGIDG